MRLSGLISPRNQDVDVLELPGVNQAAQKRTQKDAALALVAGVDRAVGTRIIELLHAAPGDQKIQALEAVVDLGALQRDAADRGNVLDQEGGTPVGLDLGDRAHGHAVAVGELQMPVDPALGLCREFLGGELAGGQHDLPELAVRPVAIRVNRREVVVEPEELDLVVDLKQRPLVPEPDVLNRPLVLGGDLRVQHAQGGMAPGLEMFQAVGLAGQLDVAGEVGRLPRQLARLHDQTLDEPRDDVSRHEVQNRPTGPPNK